MIFKQNMEMNINGLTFIGNVVIQGVSFYMATMKIGTKKYAACRLRRL